MKDLSGKFEEDLHKARRRGRFSVTRKPGDLMMAFKITYLLECPPGRRHTRAERGLLAFSRTMVVKIFVLGMFFFIFWSAGADGSFWPATVLLSVAFAGFILRLFLLRLTFFVRFLPDKFQFGRQGKRNKQYQLPLEMLTGFTVDEPSDREIQAAVFDVFVVTNEKKYVFLENVDRKFGEEVVTKLTGLHKEFLETLEPVKKEAPVEI